jgi:alpha-galactosidase
MMKFIGSRILLVLFVINSLACDANDLAGHWLTRPTAGGYKPSLLFFERRNDLWIGYGTSPFGRIEFRDVKLENGKVSFIEVLDIGVGRDALPPVKVQGLLENGELRLNVSSPLGGTKERLARKVGPAEVATLKSKVVGTELSTPRVLPHNGLARTPPMGWNSWNKFGLDLNDKLVREIADALVSTGLRDAGYIYVNVDDGWQGTRDADGIMHPNSKFTDMKALGEYIHSRGLKFGMYSSPGLMTCAGFAGSYGYEEQDAKTYAEWGVDYLKYDWCSADLIYDTPGEMQAAYRKMALALRNTGRSIVYALCQYGLFDVGKWGRDVGGNVWRVTFDILDNWAKMEEIGFTRHGTEHYAGPGGWNDPDMLEVGNNGMTVDEYRTHMTLWSMLSAPLLLGNDVRNMPPEIAALVMNKEVILIDQDSLGKQAHRLSPEGRTEIWGKPLAGGASAVALFNRSEVQAVMDVRWSDLGFSGVSKIRDLWRQTDLPIHTHDSYRVALPPHGSMLLRVEAKRALTIMAFSADTHVLHSAQVASCVASTPAGNSPCG